jgi:hypothetical protein
MMDIVHWTKYIIEPMTPGDLDGRMSQWLMLDQAG